MLKSLDFVMLYVPNLEQARSFYTEKIGFEVDEQQPGFVQFKRLNGGGAIFAVFESAKAEPVEGGELWWTVDDVDAEYDRLLAQDVQIVTPPTDQPFGRTISVKDPAGHTLNLMQLTPRS